MTTDRIDKLLEDIRYQSDAYHDMMEQVRTLALSLGEDVTEEVKYGGLLFSVQTHFAGVFAYARHISVELSEGAALPDPHQVLEGGGKHRRHIKLRTMDDINQKHVADYLRAAYNHITDI